MRIEIIAVGRLKSGPLAELAAEYSKRLHWPLKIHEIETRLKDSAAKADEIKKIDACLDGKAYIIALDERGKGLRSQDFAKKIEQLQTDGIPLLQFVIGGADGLSDSIRARAGLVMGLGVQTWPHMLARIMLLEQIYRAQQIIAGHPYHRE